jgi:hypothetical protein
MCPFSATCRNMSYWLQSESIYQLFMRSHLNTFTFPYFPVISPITLIMLCISFLLHPSFWWSCKHSSAKSSLMVTCFQMVFLLSSCSLA